MEIHLNLEVTWAKCSPMFIFLEVKIQVQHVGKMNELPILLSIVLTITCQNVSFCLSFSFD